MSAEETTKEVEIDDTSAPTSAPASKSAKPKSTKGAAGKPRSSVGTPAKKAPATASTKDYKPGDIVLARLKGYPPWPARIADPDNVPKAVLSSRKDKSGVSYCVNYFPAGDFSWLSAKDLKPLTPSEINEFLAGGHRKATGALRQAFETAKDPADWIKNQETALKEREAEQVAADEDVDQLEEEEEEEEETGGKRKRASKAAAPANKKTKAGKKADEEPTPKAKATKAKKAAAPASVPENQAPADDDPLASDPECVKVKDWRHKLQRAFLGKGLPGANEMDTYNDLFNTIENYKEMTIEALQYSKIGKVMKKIATLEGIPRNDELKLTDRASKLMNDWADFISNSAGDKTNGSAGAETNGNEASKSEKKEEPKAEDTTTEAAPAESSEEKKEESTTEANGKTEEGEKMDVEA